MSKTYLIETRQTYIIGYAVVMDDDADPKEIAEKIIAGDVYTEAGCCDLAFKTPTELYQYAAPEEFEQCIPLSDGQTPKVFRAKNDYLSHLSNEEIIERFIMDFRTNKEEKE